MELHCELQASSHMGLHNQVYSISNANLDLFYSPEIKEIRSVTDFNSMKGYENLFSHLQWTTKHLVLSCPSSENRVLKGRSGKQKAIWEP
jgi:hypothetical protein